MRSMGLALLALAVGGCGGTKVGYGDRFGAGKWELEGWMESDQGSTRDVPGAVQTDTVDLSAQQADDPPASVFFSRFYHGEKEWSDVSFHNGEISGNLHKGRTDVPLSGSYGPDHFKVTFHFGGNFEQVVEGKLTEPAS